MFSKYTNNCYSNFIWSMMIFFCITPISFTFLFYNKFYFTSLRFKLFPIISKNALISKKKKVKQQ